MLNIYCNKFIWAHAVPKLIVSKWLYLKEAGMKSKVNWNLFSISPKHDKKVPSPYFIEVQQGTETNTEIFMLFKIFHIKYPAFLLWPLQLLNAKKSLDSFLSTLKSLERAWKRVPGKRKLFFPSILEWELCDKGHKCFDNIIIYTQFCYVPGYTTKLSNR